MTADKTRPDAAKGRTLKEHLFGHSNDDSRSEWWKRRVRVMQSLLQEKKIGSRNLQSWLEKYDFHRVSSRTFRRYFNEGQCPDDPSLFARSFSRMVAGRDGDDEDGRPNREKAYYALIMQDESAAGTEAVSSAKDAALPRLANYPGTAQSEVGELGTPLCLQPRQIFVDAGYLKERPFQKSVGDVLSLKVLRGSAGLAPGKIVVHETGPTPNLPDYVADAVLRTEIDGEIRNKAIITHFMQYTKDARDMQVVLELGKTNYRIHRAMIDSCRGPIETDLVSGRFSVFDGVARPITHNSVLPHFELHCDATVITKDNKIILAQRGGTNIVENNAYQWQASIGESLDWDEDRHEGKLHPLRTIWRGMYEEIGLDEGWMKQRFGSTTEVIFLELGFSMNIFAHTLFAVVRCPDLEISEALERAANKRDDVEQTDFGFMDFSANACASAFVSGEVDGKKLNDASRFNIMLAAEQEFSIEFRRHVTEEIEQETGQRQNR